jgi:predicted DNA-binding transcriptional regulator YafY
MKLKRISRLLKLLQTLQSGQGDNADRLAQACSISRRTLFRDLETLKAAGVPLEFDSHTGRYLIAGDFFLRPTNFTPAEALSIIALASQLGGDADTPLFGAARSAALKLESSLPPALRRELESVAQAINLRIPAADAIAGQESVYETLVSALAERRVAKIVYQSLTEWDQITTNLRPYQLLFCRHSWYIIGGSSLHRETRTFNLSRIQSIELLKQKYVRPRGFDVDRYLGNAWNLIPHSGPDDHVVVRFASMVAKNVAEVSWHRTQRTELLADGSLDFHVDVSGLNEIVWWILGYGDQAEVIAPAKLRRLVAQRAKNLHALYARDVAANNGVLSRQAPFPS